MSRMKLIMSWDELKMRARDGAGRQILADLNGVDYKTFNAILKEEESIHGEKIVFNQPKKDNRLKSSSAEKKERNEAIVKDYTEGKTMKEVAAKYGVTPATVLNVLRKYREKGLVPERKKQEPKQKVNPEPAETKSDLDDDLLRELCRICAEHEKNYELAAAGIKTLESQMEKERKIIQQLNKMMGGEDMTEPKRLYLCDKKEGACSGWEKGWTRCMNEMCDHTTNSNHARMKTGHQFVLLDKYDGAPVYMEVEHD